MGAPTGLIALMGATGSGKSSFTNSILGEYLAVVGDNLDSQTSEVHEYPYILPNGANVRIVDTPGFDDSRLEGGNSNLEVLQMIAKFLKSKRELEQKFSGIIYMHNITSPRVSRMMRRNMSIFKKLCGNESMKNVVVVTTFWDLVWDTQNGIDDEHEFQTEDGLLKELYDGGAKFVRAGHFEEGKRPSGEEYLTPQQIVDHLLSLDPVYAQMQRELATEVSVADIGNSEPSLPQGFEELTLALRGAIEDSDRNHRDFLRTALHELRDQLLVHWDARGREMGAKMADWEMQKLNADDGKLSHEVSLQRDKLIVEANLEAIQRERDALKAKVNDLENKVEDLEKEKSELSIEAKRAKAEILQLSHTQKRHVEDIRREATKYRELQALYQSKADFTQHSVFENTTLKNELYSMKKLLIEVQDELHTERKTGSVKRLLTELQTLRAQCDALQLEMDRMNAPRSSSPYPTGDRDATGRFEILSRVMNHMKKHPSLNDGSGA